MKKETNNKKAPSYITIAQMLRDEISLKGLLPGDFLTKEAELSRKLDLSRMTVRRAVDALVAEGLVSRRAGCGVFLRDSASRSVRVFPGSLLWPPSVHISRAATTEAAKSGVNVQLMDAINTSDGDAAQIRALSECPGLSGAVILSQHSQAFNRALCSLYMANFPFVVMDQALHEIDVPSVVSDNVLGGSLAAEELIQNGHQNIAFVGDLAAATVTDRLAGVKAACEAVGSVELSVHEVFLKSRYGDTESEARKVIAKVLASKKGRPTALICSSDIFARGAYRECEALGFSVPRDISVIGFDDDPVAEWLNPPLTSVRQDFAAMGRCAMQLLLNRIKHPGLASEHIVLPVTLVKRASVARPHSK